MKIQENQANYIYSALRRGSTPVSDLREGDLVVVTGETTDTVGFVGNIRAGASQNVLPLITHSGKVCIDNASSRFIHVLRKNALCLEGHHEYERDLVDIIGKHKDEHLERPQYSVDKSDKSVLPTSKLSLSLRKKVD